MIFFSGKSKLPTQRGKVLFGVLLVAITAFLFLPIPQVKRDSDNNFDQVLASQAIEKLNERLNLIEIVKSKLPSIAGLSPKSQYLITIKEEFIQSIHYFDIYEYWIETGGRPLKMQTSGICALVDSINRRDSTVAEALKEIELGVGFKLFGLVNFDIGGLNGLIIELAVALRTLYRVNSEEIRVLVKGYADGSQKKNWQRPFKSPDYDYKLIEVLPRVNENSLNPIEYFSSPELFPLPDSIYNNSMLPNLRAQFISNDFIKPFLKTCSQKNVIMNIIDGYEFREANQPLKRLVEVYIQYY